MKKIRKVLIGILLSLAMSVSGVAGVTAQLHPVYASEMFTVTFVSQGQVVSYKTVEAGGAVQNVKLMNMDGFVGWYLDGSPYVFDTPVNQDIILTAVWASEDESEIDVWKCTEDTEASEDDVYDASFYEQQTVEPEYYDPAVTDTVPAEDENTAALTGDENTLLAAPAEGEVNDVETSVEATVSNEASASAEETVPEEDTDPEEEAVPEEDTDPEEETVPEEDAVQTEESISEETAGLTEESVSEEETESAAAAEETAESETESAESEEEPVVQEEETAESEEESAVQEETAAAAEKAPEASETAETEEAAEAGEAEEAAPAEDDVEDAKAKDDLLKAPETFDVTFDVQGHGTAPETQKVESGKTATKPTDPTAEGYVFGGWFTGKECAEGTEYNFENAVTANVTVYAKWTIVTYTVSFTTARGTAPAVQTVNYGEKASQPSLTDVGYTCTGWTTADGAAYDFASPVKSDLALTAVWRANKYTIHFDPNNTTYATAIGATADVQCTYDTEAKLTAVGFSRGPDWAFTGWNTAANGSGTAYADQAAVKNLTAVDGATVTLYAQWKYIYRMISGAGASVSKLDSRGLTFQTNGIYGFFTGIAVDGTVVNANNYTSWAGNYGTFVTLKQSFIQNLSVGQHAIQFFYSDGSVSCNFYVNTSTVINPVKTGDNSRTGMWAAILAGAAALAVGLVFLKKKYRS